ncbi:Kinase [Hexamita inflata]|uniref:non-specific serine/threonine protein kinase n=1 Tax=Hexamita inflata TaxID=28002 RepID=A0AA86URI4_9EUKA|nr:AGC [Hexamita inflata]
MAEDSGKGNSSDNSPRLGMLIPSDTGNISRVQSLQSFSRKNSTTLFIDTTKPSQFAQLQQILTQHKDYVNQDFIAFLQRLNQDKNQTKVIRNLQQFVKDFLAVPSQAFTIKQLGNCVAKLQHIVLYLIQFEPTQSNKKHVLIALSAMTNLGSILTGSLQGPAATPRKRTDALSSILSFPYQDSDEQYIFNFIFSGLSVSQQKTYLQKNPEQMEILNAQNRPQPKNFLGFGKKKTAEPIVQQKEEIEENQLQVDEKIDVILNSINEQIKIQMNMIDEVDSDARGHLNINPPRFPCNVSPIERNLQYLMDLLQLIQDEEDSSNDFELMRTRLQSMNVSISEAEEEPQSISFDTENPFAFCVDEEQDYIFSETRNNFYSQDTSIIRPLFLYALSSATSTYRSQRALFTLEIEGQYLCGLSILTEELQKNMSFNEIKNLLDAIRILSGFANRTYNYTYGQEGLTSKLLNLQQIKIKTQEVNELLKIINRQIFGNIQIEHQFMTCKRGYMSTQTIILSQIVNLHHYMNLQVKKKQVHIRQESKDQPVNDPNFLNYIQTSQDDIYVSEQFYHDIPCDSIQKPVAIANVIQESIFTDRFGNEINRFYISASTFDITCHLISAMVSKIKLILKQPLQIPDPPIYKSDTQLSQMLLEQFKTVKLSGYCVQQFAESSSESDTFIDLLKQIHLKREHINRLVVQKQDSSDDEKIEGSTVSVVRLKRQPEGSMALINNDNETKIFTKNLQLSDFTPIRKINAGGYGTVVLVYHKSYKHPLAIKIIKKEDMIRKNSVNRIKLEQQIYKIIEQSQIDSRLKKVKAKFSDFVVRFFGSFRTVSHLFIVLDYCSQGDLGSLNSSCGALGEDWTRQLVAEIVVGLSILHACGIIYNDMKPENILMGDDGHIKFTDFGISQVAVKDKLKKNPRNPTNSRPSILECTCETNADKFIDKSDKNDPNKSQGSPKFELEGFNLPRLPSGSIFKMIDDISPKVANEITSPQIGSYHQFQSFGEKMFSPDRYLLSENSFTEMKSMQVPIFQQLNHVQEDVQKEKDDQHQQTVIGTPFYLAPELLQEQQPSIQSDFWALGVCVFEFLYGNRPFEDQSNSGDPDVIFQKILNEEVVFPDDDGVSNEAKDLIKKFLTKDPCKRLHKFKEIQEHPFFAGINWEQLFKMPPVVKPVVKPIEQIPMFKDCTDWVEQILGGKDPQAQPGANTYSDDQWKDFSYTNQNLLLESEIKRTMGDDVQQVDYE